MFGMRQAVKKVAARMPHLSLQNLAGGALRAHRFDDLGFGANPAASDYLRDALISHGSSGAGRSMLDEKAVEAAMGGFCPQTKFVYPAGDGRSGFARGVLVRRSFYRCRRRFVKFYVRFFDYFDLRFAVHNIFRAAERREKNRAHPTNARKRRTKYQKLFVFSPRKM